MVARARSKEEDERVNRGQTRTGWRWWWDKAVRPGRDEPWQGLRWMEAHLRLTAVLASPRTKSNLSVCPATTPSHNLVLSVYLCLKSMGRCLFPPAPPSLGSMLPLHQPVPFPNLLNLFPTGALGTVDPSFLRKIPSPDARLPWLHVQALLLPFIFLFCLFLGSVTAQLLFILARYPQVMMSLQESFQSLVYFVVLV